MSLDLDKLMRRLADAGVRRLEHLEVLLALARQPAGAWDGERVALASTLAQEVAARALEHLHGCGLVTLVDPRGRGFRLDPRAPAVELDALAQLHGRDRARVTNAFFACALDGLRSFVGAQARRKKE